MKSAAQVRATSKYDKKSYDQIKFIAKKSDRLRDLIALAASRKNVTSGEYMRRAICNALIVDGVTVSDLECKDNVKDEVRSEDSE